MIELILALKLSLGVGYGITKDFNHEPENIRGIVKVEHTVQSDDPRYTMSFGWLHNSGWDNGFKGSPGDRDTIYMVVDIPIKL